MDKKLLLSAAVYRIATDKENYTSEEREYAHNLMGIFCLLIELDSEIEEAVRHYGLQCGGYISSSYCERTYNDMLYKIIDQLAYGRKMRFAQIVLNHLDIAVESDMLVDQRSIESSVCATGIADEKEKQEETAYELWLKAVELQEKAKNAWLKLFEADERQKFENDLEDHRF